MLGLLIEQHRSIQFRAVHAHHPRKSLPSSSGLETSKEGFHRHVVAAWIGMSLLPSCLCDWTAGKRSTERTLRQTDNSPSWVVSPKGAYATQCPLELTRNTTEIRCESTWYCVRDREGTVGIRRISSACTADLVAASQWHVRCTTTARICSCTRT